MELSPPSSISLPEHYAFPPLTGQDPPPTDGPNTRDRLSRGLLPKSGRVGPPEPFEFEDYSQTTREGGGGNEESWYGFQGTVTGWEDIQESYTEYGSSIRGGRSGREEEEEAGEYYPSVLDNNSSHHVHHEDLSFSSSSASSIYVADSYTDPTLRPSTTSSSTSSFISPLKCYNYGRREFESPETDENPFSFHPPPLREELAQTLYGTTTARPEQHRIFSNATIVEHDSSFEVEEAGSGGLNKSTTSNGLGITKEEWLRLGGFADDDSASLERCEKKEDDEEGQVDVFGTVQAPTLSSLFASPPPLFSTPSPPRSIPGLCPSSNKLISTFVLPGPPPPVFAPTRVETNQFPSPLVLPPSRTTDISLPTPPLHYHSSSAQSPLAPFNKPASPLKSPRKKTTTKRPEPYPTSSASHDIPIAPSLKVDVVIPSDLNVLDSIGGGGGGGNLSPVSSALAAYRRFPIPSVLPPRGIPSSSSSSSSSTMVATPSMSSSAGGGLEEQDENQEEKKKKKKSKSHSRKTSIGHIPRPRNPFILFRSHIVSNALIPRTTFTISTNPVTGEQEWKEKAVDHQNVSKVVGKVWKSLTKEEKEEWERLAEREKERHGELYPGYKYRPKSRKGTLKSTTTTRGANFGRRRGVGGESDGTARRFGERDEDDDEEMDIQMGGEEEGGGGQPAKRERVETRQSVNTPPLHRATYDLESPVQGGGDIVVVDTPAPSNRSAPSSTSSTVHRYSPQSPYELKTPTKQRPNSSRGGGLVDSSPASSNSPLSPHTSRMTGSKRHHHPYARPAPSTRYTSPASSSVSSSSPSKHPLSRSETLPSSSFLPPSPLLSPLNNKQSHYSRAGLGVLRDTFNPFPPPPAPPRFNLEQPFHPVDQTASSSSSSSTRLFDSFLPSSSSPSLHEHEQVCGSPLPPPPPPPPRRMPSFFTGPTNSRQFSLGRWELRKPSNPPSQQRSGGVGVGGGGGGGGRGEGLMERALEARGEKPRVPSSALLELDPRQFLTDSGLFDNDDDDDDDDDDSTKNQKKTNSSRIDREEEGGGREVGEKEEEEEEEEETFSTWETLTEAPSSVFSSSSALTTSTAPTSNGSRAEQEQSQPLSSEQVPGVGGGNALMDLFHFGSVDLFAKPPQALVGRSSSGLFPNGLSNFSAVGGGQANVGLGIEMEHGGVDEHPR